MPQSPACCASSCCESAPAKTAAQPSAAENPAPRARAQSFRITGMCCVEEIALLKAEVGPLVGGADNLAFDVLNGKMTVLTPGAANEAILQAVRRAGMTAQVWTARSSLAMEQDRRNWRPSIMAGVSGLTTCAGYLLDTFASAAPLTALAAFATAILTGLWVVLPKAVQAARRLRPDMNLLMTIAVLGAIALGDWLEAASVAFLFALSLALEGWSAGRARRAIAALMELSPPLARVKTEQGEVEMPPEEVPVGAAFVVRPGERIPLDGRILSGESSVNQAPITGESSPVAKAPGDEVFAGTVNGDGALEALNLKPAQDTLLAHVARLVEEAQSKRSAVERWVDSFAAVYTPIVMGLAGLVMLGPPLLMGAEWGEWIYRALVLLVIACPCALVISTPVTVVAAMAAAARHGVLVKGGEFLEIPARLKAIAFDKTGTITEGKPSVERLVPLNGHSEEELLSRAAALEARSTHPIALAILAHAAAKGVAIEPAEGVQALPGKGVYGTSQGRFTWLGSHRYFAERGGETADILGLAGEMESHGHSVVVVGGQDHVCGLISLSDAIRPEAKAALAALRQSGVERLVMLTGDNRQTAERIAAALGITEVRAELLPEDKVSAVRELVASSGCAAMVGDGVNDAPAMATASLGIAMGAAGTDTAIETADLALMSDDLGKLAWLVGHSCRMRAILRQNISFAITIKAAFTVLAFAGAASLWGAIAADMGTSLLVVFNSLRMLRLKKDSGLCQRQELALPSVETAAAA
jgi:Cd2+/Zn2+-exporting ATPase